MRKVNRRIILLGRAIADSEATGEPLGSQTEPKAGIDDQGNVVIA